MSIFYKIVAFLGGLAMFLYGMRVMGDGLKSSSGGAMQSALARVTNKPVMGFLLGMLVACIIQSSTATIVITVGLVGAGLLANSFVLIAYEFQRKAGGGAVDLCSCRQLAVFIDRR